jgi:hypothetical protein
VSKKREEMRKSINCKCGKPPTHYGSFWSAPYDEARPGSGRPLCEVHVLEWFRAQNPRYIITPIYPKEEKRG